jgi:hypothetical protein
MQSLLDAPRYQTLPPADRIALGKAEDAAHDAVVLLYEQVRKALPDDLKRHAPGAAFVGLFTGLSRLIAETQEPHLGLMLAQGLAKITEMEVIHWQAEGGR